MGRSMAGRFSQALGGSRAVVMKTDSVNEEWLKPGINIQASFCFGPVGEIDGHGVRRDALVIRSLCISLNPPTGKARQLQPDCRLAWLRQRLILPSLSNGVALITCASPGTTQCRMPAAVGGPLPWRVNATKAHIFRRWSLSLAGSPVRGAASLCVRAAKKCEILKD